MVAQDGRSQNIVSEPDYLEPFASLLTFCRSYLVNMIEPVDIVGEMRSVSGRWASKGRASRRTFDATSLKFAARGPHVATERLRGGIGAGRTEGAAVSQGGKIRLPSLHTLFSHQLHKYHNFTLHLHISLFIRFLSLCFSKYRVCFNKHRL